MTTLTEQGFINKDDWKKIVGPVSIRDIGRMHWIWWRWVNVQELQDAEPSYIVAGLRPIEEAKEAAEQFDFFLYGHSTQRGE